MVALYNLLVYISTEFFLYYLINPLDIEENRYYDEIKCTHPS